jgi:hypothetical protein
MAATNICPAGIRTTRLTASAAAAAVATATQAHRLAAAVVVDWLDMVVSVRWVRHSRWLSAVVALPLM